MKLRYIFIPLLVFLGLLAVSLALSFVAPWRESAANIDRVDWLPEYASNVSYTQTYNSRIFEFDIAEPDFRKWANQYELVEINEPFYIERFNYVDSVGIHGPQSGLVDPPEFDPETVAIVTDGLQYYSWTDSRGGVAVCFDRKIGRAYFHSRLR